MRGSGSLPAWSLEYRAGLRGAFAVETGRAHGSEVFSMTCPSNCATHAPLSHLYEARFTYQLDDTVVNTTSGATLMCGTPAPPFFVRESISWPFESILSHGLDIPEVKAAKPGPQQPATIFPTTSNYYHWLIEELPMVLRARKCDPDVLVLAHAEGITDRHRAVARVMGFTIHNAPKTVRLAHHVLPGRANDSWFIHPADASILEHFGRSLVINSTDKPQRIYISRRGDARSVSGEAQLEQILNQAGFTIVSPGSLTWEEQISVFQSARIIVGPHGAGLANAVFSETGARVIELTNARHYNRCFEWLCHVKEHSYVPISSDDGTYETPDALAKAIINVAD
jgi:hypothetical protein